MVLDDVLVAENTPEDTGRLLDDARVGNGIDDAPLAMANRVAQRESQRRSSDALSPAHSSFVAGPADAGCGRGSPGRADSPPADAGVR